MQCAIVIKDLADRLDRDAHDVLRRGLAPLAEDALLSIDRGDLSRDEYAVHALTGWMARVPSSMGWRRRSEMTSDESRTPRELVAAGLESAEIQQLTHFMAANTERGSRAERLITARQRRRNINSQTRQMIKPLDLEWLRRHVDNDLSESRIADLFTTAQRLCKQMIEDPIDIERWRREVPDFRADVTSVDAAESQRTRISTTSEPTTRTYRASWVKFWLDNGLSRILMQLMDEPDVVVSVERMLGDQDGNEGTVQLLLRKPHPDDLLRFPTSSTSFRSFSPSRDASSLEHGFSEPMMSRVRPPRRASQERGPEMNTRSDQMPERSALPQTDQSEMSTITADDRLRLVIHPQGRPGDGFSRTWPTSASAEQAVERFIDSGVRLSGDAELWDFSVSIKTESGTVTVNRAGQTPPQMHTEVKRLIAHIESLA